ncbi:hypothetical protein RFI_08502, partial [Reticulomyxa filosa]
WAEYQETKDKTVVKPELDVLGLIPAPIFQPNDFSQQCTMSDCKTKFGLLNRRHHCHYCGRLACAKCTNYTLPHRLNPTISMRCCRHCQFCDQGRGVTEGIQKKKGCIRGIANSFTHKKKKIYIYICIYKISQEQEGVFLYFFKMLIVHMHIDFVLVLACIACFNSERYKERQSLAITYSPQFQARPESEILIERKQFEDLDFKRENDDPPAVIAFAQDAEGNTPSSTADVSVQKLKDGDPTQYITDEKTESITSRKSSPMMHTLRPANSDPLADESFARQSLEDMFNEYCQANSIVQSNDTMVSIGYVKQFLNHVLQPTFDKSAANPKIPVNTLVSYQSSPPFSLSCLQGHINDKQCLIFMHS